MNEENEQRENVRMTRRRQQKKEMQMRLIKIGSMITVFLVLIGAITGLYFHGKNTSGAKTTEISTSKTVTQKESTKTEETQESTKASDAATLAEQLQGIVAAYSKKIEEVTPRLIEEYQAEIQHNQDGVTGLSIVANQKARALQAISDEGISQLRAKYESAQTKEGVELDTLITQLSANYTAQVAKISDIYLRTSAALQVKDSSSQETSETETSTTTQVTEAQSNSDDYTQGQSASETTNSQSSQAATTVVRDGEGPNQIAERTGVPVETILSLNGMTMDNYFLNPGEVLRLN